MNATAFELQLGEQRVAGLRAGTPSGLKVLALHGWLDNAASFLPLAEQLPMLDIAMVDLPGHGFSDHLPLTTPYTTPQAIVQTLAIADALGWERFVLLGHSMGAAIASLVAAVAGERVQALVSIEALGGLAAPANETVQRLRAHVDAAMKLDAKQLRVFPDLAAPVRARMMVNQLSESSARLLVERGVQPVEGGWTWRSDPRLMLPTAVRMTEDQVCDVVSTIQCPVQVIYATPAQPYFPEPERSQRAALLPDGRLHTLAGHHHVHMDDPQAVASIIVDFIATLPGT
ncbi:alpha/beta hydrolase [Stenotrophomonas sp. SY1]|uniref:alpha/beta fold hydrolase n=1 Tax=Stenotrophomonas sp. SY1 TaxID=477235 RepID=UPI001E513DEA|nr:alpha/beta hydrolase [Stenotrophomonas sp. SY1]MCD9085280.1 alpha/beta hydrolase [Stenotrophomonas sp. SY1]